MGISADRKKLSGLGNETFYPGDLTDSFISTFTEE